MVSKFKPDFNKVYFINKYTMLHILQGSGGIEVDFRSFHDWDDKLIFLEKGQYIKFLDEGFVVRKIEFEDEDIFHKQDFRVLFKHLVSLGYINFKECTACQQYLNNAIFSRPDEILDISSKQWYWQNPFNAAGDEYHIIFDVKDMIDSQFKNHLTNDDIIRLINHYELNPQAIFTQKVGITIKGLLGNKRLIESKKEIAFSDKSIKEIAYNFGYKDPAFFNRSFKSNTGSTPLEFRKNTAFDGQDAFLLELYELLHQNHTDQRQVDFYAQQMHLSVKTLSKKVKEKLQISIGQLIRRELIKTAKQYLDERRPVKDIALALNFEEANHFTAFFKHYTGATPSEYQLQKVQ